MAKLGGGKNKKQKSSRPDGWRVAGIRIPLRLTVKQERYARRCVGISRFVYNMAVATHRFHRKNRMRWPSVHEMEKAFNAAKWHDYPFVTEVSKFVAQGGFRDFNNSLARWRNPSIRSAPPTFHKKKATGTGSFLAASGVDRIKYDGHYRIALPGIGSVKISRELPVGTPYEVRISRSNGRWYASVNYWKPPITTERQTQAVGGVDVGINPLAADSDATEYENPKAHYEVQDKLRRWQRTQARRQNGSRGWWEAQRRLDKLFRRLNGLRGNVRHHTSLALVRKYDVLGMESLNVKGLIASGVNSKAMSDAAVGHLLSTIRYKAEWYGTRIVTAPRWFPSSKQCSECDLVNHELGRQRRWTCPYCGVEHDRNINSARNLKKLALGAVGSDVTLPDGEALAVGSRAGNETAPDDGRTALSLPTMPALGPVG